MSKPRSRQPKGIPEGGEFKSEGSGARDTSDLNQSSPLDVKDAGMKPDEAGTEVLPAVKSTSDDTPTRVLPAVKAKPEKTQGGAEPKADGDATRAADPRRTLAFLKAAGFAAGIVAGVAAMPFALARRLLGMFR